MASTPDGPSWKRSADARGGEVERRLGPPGVGGALDSGRAHESMRPSLTPNSLRMHLADAPHDRLPPVMRGSTYNKLIIAAIFCIVFSVFALKIAWSLARVAMGLARVAAMHSVFFLALVAVIGIWVATSRRSRPR